MKRWPLLILIALVVFAGIFLLKKPPELPPPLPRIAIVIDDWGYNKRYFDFLEETNFPITISVLPGLRYSKAVAKTAHQAGKEVILHLPLEPDALQREYVRLERNTILCSMEPDEIITCLKKASNSVPYHRGISNHMGSKATRDSKTMGVIFEELKKRDLFFLDNVVTNNSVCKDLAAKMELGCIERNVFLDNESDKQYIKGQIEELLAQAQVKGYAVGVSHARKKTIEVLKEELPKIKESGFELVFVSELAK